MPPRHEPSSSHVTIPIEDFDTPRVLHQRTKAILARLNTTSDMYGNEAGWAMGGVTERLDSTLSELGFLGHAVPGVGLRLPQKIKRDNCLAILYFLGDASNIVHQANTGRAGKLELGDHTAKG